MRDRAVIFDLDGTLLNTLEDLADSMNHVLAGAGFPKHPLEAFKKFVGDGMENLVRRALPGGVEKDAVSVGKYLTLMREEYGRRHRNKTRPYPGVPALLDGLVARSIPMAILSNKPHEATRRIAEDLLAGWRFEQVLGERPGIPRKPDPAGALEIAAHMGIPPERFLYLGDTDTDMITAVRAGMFPVGVLWGFREAPELLTAGAKVLIESPEDLFPLL
ncbi:MAG: HAD family hydrolase [Deltaproteobacteria bacterium]|nr:HAD family hydrolase [Deltaproteobacteria bacterium]